MSAGLLHMNARVQPPPTWEELNKMSNDDLLNALIHEELWVVGGANYRGEVVTRETTARRDAFRAEIANRLDLLDQYVYEATGTHPCDRT